MAARTPGSGPGRHAAVHAARGGPEPAATTAQRDTAATRDRLLDASLVRVRDLAGRPRGTGFAADHHGTVITSHEAVDGLARLVLHVAGAGDRSCVVTAADVIPLPELDLALVRTEGLGLEPLPVTVRDGVETGAYVRIAAGGWREARVLGTATVTYTATDRFHLLDGALDLAIGTAGRDALRRGGGAAGGPVLDLATGTVVAVLGTALQSGHRDTGFAVPLRPRAPGPARTEGDGTAGHPLADLLARNAATVPAYGPDLNLAGVLELTATSVAQDGPQGALPHHAPPPDPSSSDPRSHQLTSASGLVGPASPGRRPGPPAPTGLTVADRSAPEPGATRPRAPRRAAASPRPGDAVRPADTAADSHPAQATTPGRAASTALPGEPTAPEPVPAPVRSPQSGETAPSAPSAPPATWTSPISWASPTSTPTGPAARPVERSAVVRELGAFDDSPALVLGLVGSPGSGRTTELAALAGRRARGDAPAPTIWLRGADLDGADVSIADAARRALDRAARIVAAARAPLPTQLTDLTPERVARLARDHGRPLLLLLDGPEEMPSALAHRLAEWTEGTARWLRGTGARLVVACREEYWEGAGAQFPPDLLHIPFAPGTAGEIREAAAAGQGPDATPGLPPCLRLGDLTSEEAREARDRYGVPDGALVDADARHPLTIRLLGEVRAALPDSPAHPRLDRADVLAAHLDLMCLRVAVRLAAQNGLRGAAVRRLAAKVSGQVHEAARRSLGPGRGEVDRETFEAVFPWGAAPAHLGGGTGWASAVLTEGLLVPAGDGYRFAHEELADWIQGIHLDLDEALRVLVHRRHIPGEPRHPLPVPHHRIGPVVQALLLLARQHGTRRLAVRLEELVCALDTDPHSWWASRLLAGVLLRVPDASPYTGVLRLLAERIVVRTQCDLPQPRGFGPGFWTALHLPDADRCDLLRRLLLADGAPRNTDSGGTSASHRLSQEPQPPRAHRPGATPGRYLDAVAHLLAADPAAVQPHLIRWFDDERPLPGAPHATVATAAQALLYTHRDRALDDLTEVLADCAHRRAEELLAVFAEEEPAALCRAVDRWAHDERPDRRAAAVAHALRTAPHTRTEADRELLCRAALTVLARPADSALHGAALALLVGDPHTRAGHLPQALRHFAAGDPHLPPSALAPALTTHPEAVLAAFGERLRRGPDADAAEVLRALVDVTTPTLARRVAALVRETVGRRPGITGHVAAYVDRRLHHAPAGAAARAVLFPLVTGLLEDGPVRLRAALGGVLAAPGTTLRTPGAAPRAPVAPADPAPRRELLDFLLAHEDDPAVLDAVLHAAAPSAEEDLRDLVHRVGLLLVRTPEGASVFDRALVELGRYLPGFAVRVIGWLTEIPQDWAAVVGPSARRTLENLAGASVLA
ncbi:trypsin-like peptidase domain-containing protein [Streptomyces sp. NRRL S-813]|uniref:trypsin-like peptidase domain-containing protein n=1 Tax=Streptomyces sp. NRRL S-813 TaxID=1463919 RepID=UPI0004BEC2B8|nr:trypsin-like peptidase domain-containing protein [Streptomyces sp. NRRL S-813]